MQGTTRDAKAGNPPESHPHTCGILAINLILSLRPFYGATSSFRVAPFDLLGELF